MSTVLNLISNERVCNACKVVKSLSDFQVDKTGTYGRKSRCRDCCNKIGRERDYPKHKRSGLKNRPDKLKRLYGITYEHVVRTLDVQHGLCANRGCGKQISLDVKGPVKQRAVIDHNHKTKKFRALLCVHCNSTLGLIETKANMLLGLLEYLTKHKEH